MNKDSSKTNLANAFQAWAKKMGYKFGPASPSQEWFERFCSGERAPAIRHLMEHVRPASEVRNIRKYVQLQKLKDQSKKKLERKHLESLQKERGVTCEKVLAEAESLKQLNDEHQVVKDKVKSRRRRLDQLARERRELEAFGSLESTARDLKEMVESTTSIPPSPQGPEEDLRAANLALEKCEEAAATAGLGQCTNAGEAGGSSAVSKQEVEMCIAEAARSVPTTALFRSFVERMESIVAQIADLNNRISDDFGFRFSHRGSVCYDVEEMHVMQRIRAAKQKKKLAKLKHDFQETYEKTLSLFLQSMNDSETSTMGTQEGADAETAVDSWLRNKVEDVKNLASVREYNRLVAEIDETINSLSDSIAEPVSNNERLTALIKEKVNSVSKYGSCADLMAHVESVKSSFVERVQNLKSCLGSTLNLNTTVSTAISASFGSSIQSDSSSSWSHYSGECLEWNSSGDQVVSDVLSKLMTSLSLETNSIVPIFDLTRAGKFPELEQKVKNDSRIREAQKTRAEKLAGFSTDLGNKILKMDSALDFWITQPFESRLMSITVADGKSYKDLKQTAVKAVQTIEGVRDIKKKSKNQ